MPKEPDIQPVPLERSLDAMCFLIAGDRFGGQVVQRAEAFLDNAQRDGRTMDFWWALRGRKPVAAAMVLDSPGRSAMLFYSHPDSPGVSTDATAQTIRTVCRQTFTRGIAFVQALLIGPPARQSRLLAEAGFSLLAELIMMRLTLPAKPGEELPCQRALTWRSYDQLPPEELRGLLPLTYEGSLDCPGLVGLRQADEIIASHKATGRFCPQTWWVVYDGDTPAGCCLVNDNTGDNTANVVYLGVAPACRGRQIGRAMVRHATTVSHQRGRAAVTLAVDSRNTYAQRLYAAEGFAAKDRRSVYILTPESSAKHAE
ncbi:MAG: GNAT family N-acetyltransferase [Planctomycetota bacterium]|jgi:ribosomal protein S18 acetylase RimI-like enzyme